MSAIVLLVLGLAAMAAGYFVYSKFIAAKIYRLDPDLNPPTIHSQNRIADSHHSHALFDQSVESVTGVRGA